MREEVANSSDGPYWFILHLCERMMSFFLLHIFSRSCVAMSSYHQSLNLKYIELSDAICFA